MYDIVKSEENRRTVCFTESSDRISSHFRDIRKQITKDLEIPGFRPGKVPRSIIEKQYGNIIKAEVADIVRRELTSAMLEEEDWILDDNDPEGKIELPAEEKAYSFEMTFSLYETPEPEGLDGIKIELPSLDIETAVEDTIDSFREKMVSFETVDRQSEEGDLVLLEAVPDGDSGEPQEFSIRIGESQIGTGFDELVLGAAAGTQFLARMDNDTEENLHPVHRFRIMDIRHPVLPELNDEFAKKAADVDSVEDLRKKVEESVRNRYEQEIVFLKEREAIDSLLESNPFDPPVYMVDNLTQDYLKRLGEEEPGKETIEATKELALKKVREFLVLRAVALKENIEITEEDINTEKNSEESAASVLDRLRNRKAVELILDRADIIDKKPRKGKDKNTSGEEPDSSWHWISVEDNGAEPNKEISREEEQS
ncbi:MAG: trigger factor [Candidatus Aegiribacteria sp.]|nr:trigger factor [Candidatus Aegiribacteria sp.]